MYYQKPCSWEYHRKTRFNASRAVSWSRSGYKERKRTTKPFTGSSDPDGKYYLPKFGHVQNAKFRDFGRFNVIQQS